MKTVTSKDNQTVTFLYDAFDNLTQKIEPAKTTYYIDKEAYSVLTIGGTAVLTPAGAEMAYELALEGVAYGLAIPDKVEKAVNIAIGMVDPNPPNTGWQGMGFGLKEAYDYYNGNN